MKCANVFQFVFLLFALIELLKAESSCTSKLEYLSLGNINTQALQYNLEATNIITVLETQALHSVDMYESSKRLLQNCWQNLVQETITFLINHARQRVKDNPNAGDRFYHCIQDSMDYISGTYQSQFISSIENCMNSNNIDITINKAAITTLNTTALLAANAICDCVEKIDQCSPEKKKETAISCAKNTANALNIDDIKNQANIIFNQIEALSNKTLWNLNTCLNGMPEIGDSKAIIIDKIDNCPVQTPL